MEEKMKSHVIALKLILDELGIEPKIDTAEQRKLIQKVVYLCQEAGLDMNYYYSWYKMGPYSPGLARTYYEMNDDILCSSSIFNGQSLNQEAKNILIRIKNILQVPEKETKLELHQWLELVASFLFLIKEAHQNKKTAKETINVEKHNLYSMVENAEKALKKHKFIET